MIKTDWIQKTCSLYCKAIAYKILTQNFSISTVTLNFLIKTVDQIESKYPELKCEQFIDTLLLFKFYFILSHCNRSK